MKIKFYFIILFCIYIQKSYNMDFLKSLDFSTGSGYTIILLSAIGYIYKDHQISKKIKNSVKEENKKKQEELKLDRSYIPLTMLLGAASTWYSLIFIKDIFFTPIK